MHYTTHIPARYTEWENIFPTPHTHTRYISVPYAFFFTRKAHTYRKSRYKIYTLIVITLHVTLRANPKISKWNHRLYICLPIAHRVVRELWDEKWLFFHLSPRQLIAKHKTTVPESYIVAIIEGRRYICLLYGESTYFRLIHF